MKPARRLFVCTAIQERAVKGLHDHHEDRGDFIDSFFLGGNSAIPKILSFLSILSFTIHWLRFFLLRNAVPATQIILKSQCK